MKKNKVTQRAEMNQEVGDSKSSFEIISVVISQSHFVKQ